MNLKRIKVSKRAVIGFSTLATAALGTVLSFFLRKKSKKPRGPNYAAGI